MPTLKNPSKLERYDQAQSQKVLGFRAYVGLWGLGLFYNRKAPCTSKEIAFQGTTAPAGGTPSASDAWAEGLVAIEVIGATRGFRVLGCV